MSDSDQIKWLLDAATSAFSTFSDSAKLDAELLLCHVLDCSRTYLFTWPDKTVTPEQKVEFVALTKRREAGEPIAHIIGKRDFWSLELNVNASTLIPRPDTETLVETALSYANGLQKNQAQGLDLGTGTGAIALALASELPTWHWLGLDKSQDAIELAKSNAILNDISNCHFAQSDWFSVINSKTNNEHFDLIVSNPPYIDKDDPHLKQGDVRFEPVTALVAEDNGLSDIKIIAEKARCFLKEGGALMFEHGYDQGQKVRDILIGFGYISVHTVKDLSANDRVSVGYLP